jgi:phosphate uptake regulator
MVFDFFRSPGRSTIESVEATLVAMLRDGRTVFDSATEALFDSGKSKATKNEVRGTDRQINQAEQEVRRALIVHASVTDSIDFPLVLTYMSVVKDAERIGDYAKNIYDLVRYGSDFSEAPDRADLERYREAVGQLIDDVAVVFEERNTERAEQLIAKADGFLDEHDKNVRAAYTYDGSAAEAVSRALYFRFLKRTTAHLMNLLTALVMPVDRLDYYDEAKEDRGPVPE